LDGVLFVAALAVVLEDGALLLGLVRHVLQRVHPHVLQQVLRGHRLGPQQRVHSPIPFPDLPCALLPLRGLALEDALVVGLVGLPIDGRSLEAPLLDLLGLQLRLSPDLGDLPTRVALLQRVLLSLEGTLTLFRALTRLPHLRPRLRRLHLLLIQGNEVLPRCACIVSLGRVVFAAAFHRDAFELVLHVEGLAVLVPHLPLDLTEVQQHRLTLSTGLPLISWPSQSRSDGLDELLGVDVGVGVEAFLLSFVLGEVGAHQLGLVPIHHIPRDPPIRIVHSPHCVWAGSVLFQA